MKNWFGNINFREPPRTCFYLLNFNPLLLFVSHKIRQAEIAEFYEFLFANNQSSQYMHEIKSLEMGEDVAIEYGKFEVVWVTNDGKEWVFRTRSMIH